MITAESMLSKRPVLRFTVVLFFLKLFSSHIYCIPLFMIQSDLKLGLLLLNPSCSKPPKDKLFFIIIFRYKDNQKLNASDLDPRMKIRNRELVSRLQIYDVYSSDSGLYRCEVSNLARRVHSTAYLKVSFSE